MLLNLFSWCHSMCSTASHCCGSALSQMSHRHSLLWICIFWGVLLPLSGLDPCCLRFSIVTNWDDSTSSQVSYACSLGRLDVASGTTLSLTLVTSCYPWCFTTSNWGGSISCFLSFCYSLECYLRCPSDAYRGGSKFSQVSHCCSHVWFCFIPGILLPLNRAAFCNTRCFTTTHCVSLGCPTSFNDTHRSGFE